MKPLQQHLFKEPAAVSEFSYVYPVKRLVFVPDPGKLCRRPYPGHRKGCPKFGDDDQCPPNTPKFWDFFHPDKPFCLVHSEFNLEAHAAGMKEKRPYWSDRQCRCVLYWQSRSRAQLTERILEAMPSERVIYSMCPEGMGLNVFATAKLAGLRLEPIKGLKTCRHVALVQYY